MVASGSGGGGSGNDGGGGRVVAVVADGTKGVAVVGSAPDVYAAVLFLRSVVWLGESMPIVRPLAPLLLLLAAAHLHRVCAGSPY